MRMDLDQLLIMVYIYEQIHERSSPYPIKKYENEL